MYQSKKEHNFGSFTLTQKELEVSNREWILLNTCSTVSVICNPDLVSNIKPCKQGDGITVITNGGVQSFDEEATLNLLPLQVHFNEDSIENILSLSDIANLPGATLIMDTPVDKAINLYYNDVVYRFSECKDGLYYCNPFHIDDNKNNNSIIPCSEHHHSTISFAQTVAENKTLYTKCDLQGAATARTAQATLGWPSTTKFKNIISRNLINNCPITVDDINRASHIYGPNIPHLQGRMTRVTPPAVRVQSKPVPAPVLQHYPEIQLYLAFVLFGEGPRQNPGDIPGFLLHTYNFFPHITLFPP